MSNELVSKKMGEMPVGRLLFKMSVPAIISMLVQSLYNVVDSVFVSMYDPDALEAVSIAYPMQMLIVAFAIGVGIGSNAQISRKLGEGDREGASKTAKNGLFLSLVCAFLFVIIGLSLSKWFISLFTGNDKIISYGTQYLTIVSAVSIGCFVEICCSKTLQATGNMKIPMISQLIGALTNIILDPIFIFGWAFVPEMGAAGAAIATVTGQIFAMIFVLTVLYTKKHDVNMSLKGFRPDRESVAGICKIGFPVMVMNAVGSFTTMIMNAIIAGYNNAITILGIYFKLQSFVFMPVFGLTQGLLPILSYNYGADNKKRYYSAFKLAVMCVFMIMVLGVAIFHIFPGALLAMFNPKPDMVENGIYALRIISLCFIPAAFGITFTTALQSVAYGKTSLLMSLFRQVIILIPAGALLASLYGLAGVWFCYPLAEIITIAIFIPITFRCINKVFAAKGKSLSGTDIIEENNIFETDTPFASESAEENEREAC